MAYPTYTYGVLLARNAAGDILPFEYQVEWDADGPRGYDEKAAALLKLCLSKGLVFDGDSELSTMETGGSFKPPGWKVLLERITMDDYRSAMGE